MLRKIIFWTHLSIGVGAAIGLLVLAVTGVLLAYEKQLEHWADHRTFELQSSAEVSPASIDEALLEFSRNGPGWAPSTITLYADPDSAIRVGGNPRLSEIAYLDPVSADYLGSGDPATRDLFGLITRWHRWFDLEGTAREIGGPVIDVSNVVLMVLALTGLYLWFPPVLRWSIYRSRLWFSPSPSSKVRDFNWHHVFSIWMLVPLFVIAFTGAVVSYNWPDRLVYFLTDSAPPEPPAAIEVIPPEGAEPMPVQYFIDRAAEASPDWRALEVAVPKPGATTVAVEIDTGNGSQPHLRQTLVFDRFAGELLRRDGFQDLPAGRQILSFAIPLHTGEALGWMGQTLALIASVALVLLIWTGLALSWRRLIQPLFRSGSGGA